MPPRAERPRRRLTEAACLAALVGVPLFFAPFSDRVFEPEKAALLRWLALVAGAGLLGAGRLPVPAAGPPAAARDRLGLALAGVWLAELLASLSSVAPGISLMGSEARGQGLLTTSALALMALAAAGLAARPGGTRRIAAFAGASLLPVGLYAVLQAHGLDPLPWDGDVVTRVSGPAGNSVMLAAHLVMALPLAGWALSRAWRLAGRRRGVLPQLGLAAWLVCVGVGVWALLLSSSRGPILGLVGGLLGLGLVRSGLDRRWTRALGLVGLGLGLAGLILALNFGPPALAPLRRLPVLDRLSIALDPERSTTRVRLRLWEGSRALLREAGPRWLAGYGPETMDLIWAPGYPPILAYDEPRGWLPDRAHSLVLDSLLTGGLLGLAATLALLGASLWRCRTWLARCARRKRAAGSPQSTGRSCDGAAEGFAAAALVALLAHAIELQLGFAVVASRLYLWVIAGALLGLGRADAGTDAEAGVEAEANAEREAGAHEDATLAALAAGLGLAFALARPGLVGGGPAAVAGLIGCSALGVWLLVFSALSDRDAWRAPVRPGRGRRRLSIGRSALGPRPVGPAVDALAAVGLTLSGFGLSQAGLAGRAGTHGADAVPFALAGLGLYLLALLLAILWHARIARRGEPSARVRLPAAARAPAGALALALLLGVWPLMAPVAAGALAKEGRRGWQAQASALNAAGQSGRAESYLARALERYAAARRWAPWEPAYDLAAARAEVEWGELLMTRAARQAGADATESRRKAEARFQAALAAIDEAAGKSGPGPLPAVLRARALRIEAIRSPEGPQRASRLSQAGAAYAAAIRLAPGWPELLDEAAMTALAAGSAREALALAERALALDPFYRVAWLRVAEARTALGAPGAAAEAYAAYFVDYRNASDLEARRAQLAALLAAGRRAEALRSARELLSLEPDDAFAQADLAALLEAEGAREEALRAADRAARLAPRDPGIAALRRRLAAGAMGRP
ncbi:MAG: O-antigen ligase family protein [Chloroflexi bacterium]|nr:O-antigen ligase family protein [Chloroflexota bacterium]